MALTLRIEPPVPPASSVRRSCSVGRAGISAGRRSTMDWILPDPDRHVSGHHFDVRFEDGEWWLIDRSTNGTFLSGSATRLSAPHRLRDGDRLVVGPYLIAVDLVPDRPQPPRPSEVGLTPWPSGDGDDPGWAARVSTLAGADDSPRSLELPEDPGTADTPERQAGSDDAILRAFCHGAGLPVPAVANHDAEALAHALGRTLRSASVEIMRTLQMRRNDRLFARGGERAVPRARANNPLSVLGDADQALETMFVTPRDGFLDGPESFEVAMADLRAHHEAIAGALRLALATVTEDLAPHRIESDLRTAGTDRTAAAWKTYVEAWYARAGESGSLDQALFDAFAEAYGRILTSRPD